MYSRVGIQHCCGDLRDMAFSILFEPGREGFTAFIPIPCPSNGTDGASLTGDEVGGRH